MSEALPCPFCGKEPRVWRRYYRVSTGTEYNCCWQEVLCETDGGNEIGGDYGAAAIEQWNKRVKSLTCECGMLAIDCPKHGLVP